MNKLDKDYQLLLQDILDNGVVKKDRTGTGTISVFGRQIRHSMKDGFPLLTTKKMAWKSIVTELLWFLRGDTNIKYLVENACHIWDGDAYKNYRTTVKVESTGKWGKLVKHESDEHGEPEPLNKTEFINKIKHDDEFAAKFGCLGPIYGKQWRNWSVDMHGLHENKLDQIKILLDSLKNNPDSRRLMVNAWNVAVVDEMILPPCHYGFQVYTRELTLHEKIDLLPEKKSLDDYDTSSFNEKIEKGPQRAISLMWNQRSVDTLLGLPFNIASYGLLLEILAKETNMVADELIGNLGDTHLYLNHIDQAKEQITRNSFVLPSIAIEGDEPSIIEKPKYWRPSDFKLLNYHSHDAIKASLSN